MTRRTFGNLLAIVLALLVGFASVYVSYTRLREPQILLDWLALIFTGLTTGVITFFLVWGHFQKDPTPPQNVE